MSRSMRDDFRPAAYYSLMAAHPDLKSKCKHPYCNCALECAEIPPKPDYEENFCCGQKMEYRTRCWDCPHLKTTDHVCPRRGDL